MDTEQKNKVRLLLALFQLGRNIFYHRDSISRVTEPSWNWVRQEVLYQFETKSEWMKYAKMYITPPL